jgi:hypothetical protein
MCDEYYKRTQMLVEWKEKRGIDIDISDIPIGVGKCVLCKRGITLYPNKEPICKECLKIYEIGKKEKERRDSLENLSCDIRSRFGNYTNNPDLFPFYQFKEFLRNYVPYRLFKEGAGKALKELEKISELTNRYHFLTGVVEGKKLLKKLNNGTISLTDFENPEKELKSIEEKLEISEKFFKGGDK